MRRMIRAWRSYIRPVDPAGHHLAIAQPTPLTILLAVFLNDQLPPVFVRVVQSKSCCQFANRDIMSNDNDAFLVALLQFLHKIVHSGRHGTDIVFFESLFVHFICFEHIWPFCELVAQFRGHRPPAYQLQSVRAQTT